jgi:hypothetical protein
MIVHQRVTTTGTQIEQNQVPQARTSALNWHEELFSWPILGIAFALLSTVTWCGFLSWLLVLLTQLSFESHSMMALRADAHVARRYTRAPGASVSSCRREIGAKCRKVIMYVSLTRGQVNAVRAAFKAGVAPTKLRCSLEFRKMSEWRWPRMNRSGPKTVTVAMTSLRKSNCNFCF